MSDSESSLSSSLDSSSGKIIIRQPSIGKASNIKALQGKIPHSTPPVGTIPQVIIKPQLPSITGKKPPTGKVQDSDDGFSSIDSKPSVRAKPKIDTFDFKVPVKPTTGPPKVAERQLSLKYEAKIRDSSSSSSSSSSFVSSSSSKELETKEKKRQMVNLDSKTKLEQKSNRKSSSSSNEDSSESSQKIIHKGLNADLKLQMNPNNPKSKDIAIEGIKIKGPGELINRMDDFNEGDAHSIDNSSSFVSQSKDDFSGDLFKKNSPEPLDIHQHAPENKDKKDSKKPDTDENGRPKNSEIPQNKPKQLGVRFEEIPHESPEPPSGIKIKKGGEIKNSSNNNRFKEIDINVDPKMIESITAKFLFSAQSLSIGQLIKGLNELNHVPENYWKKKGCMSAFCKCFRDSNQIPLNKQASIFKLIKLGEAKYDNSNEFHRNIMMSYYIRYTTKAEFEDTPQTWTELGFIDHNPAKNELSEPCILLTILHMIYLFENKVQISRKLLSIRKDSKISTMRILQSLMQNSLDLLKRQGLNELIRSQIGSDEIHLFFEFHSGAMQVWLDIFISTGNFEESKRETFSRVKKNPSLYWSVFKNISKAN